MTPTQELRATVNERAAEVFAAIGAYDEESFIAEIDAIAAQLPADDPDGLFHRACAQDSWGHSDQAIPLYRKALGIGGLTGENRRRAVIQMGSSLRNIGEVEPALELLLAERDHGSDHLDDALTCTTALCLASLGRDREGLAIVVVALAKHLPRYQRSMANYGEALVSG